MAAPTPARRRTAPTTRVVDGSRRHATATVQNRALKVAPRPRPDAPAVKRPPLRLVDDARLTAAQRQRRARLIVLVSAVLATGTLFLVAAFNAMLVTGQSRIDELQVQVQEAQAEYSANRLAVAKLEAPEHVVRVAQERLGMVPPPSVKYLTPSEAMAAQVEQGGTTASTASSSASTSSGASSSWAATKPYLGATP
jgi:hypothetical protein